VRAPARRGRAWLGTGGRDVEPEQLRGRIVLLDFWTAGPERAGPGGRRADWVVELRVVPSAPEELVLDLRG
jgi:hypothetical protein